MRWLRGCQNYLQSLHRVGVLLCCVLISHCDCRPDIFSLLVAVAHVSAQPSTSEDLGPGVGPDDGLAATLRALAEQQARFPGREGGGDDELINGVNEDFLEQLASQLRKIGPTDLNVDAVPEEGGEADLPGMATLVDTIMHQLLSKDVLYQPMKDIGARYPAWLEAHRHELEPAEVRRYQEQLEYIEKICLLYETRPDDYAGLMELLQEVGRTLRRETVSVTVHGSFVLGQIKERRLVVHDDLP